MKKIIILCCFCCLAFSDTLSISGALNLKFNNEGTELISSEEFEIIKEENKISLIQCFEKINNLNNYGNIVSGNNIIINNGVNNHNCSKDNKVKEISVSELSNIDSIELIGNNRLNISNGKFLSRSLENINLVGNSSFSVLNFYFSKDIEISATGNNSIKFSEIEGKKLSINLVGNSEFSGKNLFFKSGIDKSTIGNSSIGIE